MEGVPLALELAAAWVRVLSSEEIVSEIERRMGTAYRHLGLLAPAQGDFTQAQTPIRKSLDLFAGFLTGWDVVRSLLCLGEAVSAAGDTSELKQYLIKKV